MADHDENNNPVNPNASENGQAALSIDDMLSQINLDDLMNHPSVRQRVQSVSDSRVTQALATAKQKWEAEQSENLDEAARLAKMTETERAKYQLQKDREALEAERAKFNHSQLVLETAKQMTAAGLPDLAEYVTGADAEATKANLQTVTGILSAWKQEQLNSVMRGAPPKDVQPQKGALSKADIQNMTPAEINKAWADGLIDTAQLK